MTATISRNLTTTRTFTYDFRGNVIDTTDQSGHVTHNEYDLAGRLVAMTKLGAQDGSISTLPAGKALCKFEK